MAIPSTPDPLSTPMPKAPSFSGPPKTSYSKGKGSGGNTPSDVDKPQTPSTSMALWEKFLGQGATPEQVTQFQSQFLNAVTEQMKKEDQKSRERRKKDTQMAAGEDF